MEDEKIIDLYFERSQQAIIETDIKYGKMCLCIAQSIILNKEDAEECVNDTYLGLWNNIPPARPQFLSAYIAKITRNLAMKKITYANAKKRSIKLTVSLEEMDSSMSSAEDAVMEKLGLEELSNFLEQFLNEQTYEGRNIFLRRYWFMDTVTEIAERFNLTERNVRNQLYKMRLRLKEQLSKEGYVL